MKQYLSKFRNYLTVLLFLLPFVSFTQVGINTINPTETLHVNGNLRIDGALMPGNTSGNTDQILLSQGSGNTPAWGPGLLNTGEIDNIGKYYVGPFNINSGYLELTVTDANMTPSSTIFITLPGNLPTGPNYGDLVITTEARTGEFRIHFANHTGFNLTNFQISYVAFYN